jgi:hypothetical protein
MSRKFSLTMLAVSVSLAVASTAALASGGRGGGGGGGSDEGDSYENDMQRNPRLIEPGADRGRYLAYYGRQGWDARQRAAGRVPEGYYYGPHGRVDVAPYGSTYYRP